MSSARSTSDGRGPVTRKGFRIGRSQGNLARTPDVAVVISLNNFKFLGPVDDTVTAHSKTQVTSHKFRQICTIREFGAVTLARAGVIELEKGKP